MRLWRRRPGRSPSPEDEPLSQRDLAWRIGAIDERPEPAPPSRPAGPAEARPVATPVRTRVRAHARPVVSGTTRRLVLWRDASAILFGIIAFALVAQLALSDDRRETAADVSSTTPGLPSDAALGATPPPGETDLATIGPVVDPGLIPGIEATSSPIPGPTFAPAETPRPTPRPGRRPTPKPTPPPTTGPVPTAVTAGPTATSVPTPSPTATPFYVAPPAKTPKPTATPLPPAPTATPAPPAPTDTPAPPAPTDTPAPPDPTPIPSPIASFSCVVTGQLDISCSDTSQFAETYLWEFGDGGTSTGANPAHAYDAGGAYTVTLTVTNASGSDFTTQDVTVPGL